MADPDHAAATSCYHITGIYFKFQDPDQPQNDLDIITILPLYSQLMANENDMS